MIYDDFLKLGGVSSKEFGIHVEKFPGQKIPHRRIREELIPGRNGVLHIDEGTYDPYIQPYEIYFHGSSPAPDTAHAIKSWLMGGGATRRLEDSYDLDHFRMATYKGPADIENHMNEYGRCIIEMQCQPQSYLISGQDPVELAAPGAITNPTAFPALPLIRVTGSGAGTLSVAGCTVKLLAIDGHVWLDSETMEAYRQDGSGAPENKNNTVIAPEYPLLNPGENQITWTGGITAVEVTPRWWEL